MTIPHVAILMATYNGQDFLGQQLASIAAQTHRNLSLWASDDGSTDGSTAIVEAFAVGHAWLPTHVLAGPGQGYVRNFLSLACNDRIKADFYAFCDQDDLWYADKLSAAMARLGDIPADRPAIYVSRTRIVGDDGAPRGMSPLFERPPGMRNALVQSIGGGNTMVFNATARDLLKQAGPDVDVPSHDWWTYLVVAACGGQVFYDPQPYVDYRQHDDNLIGENSSFAARLLRINLLLQGRFSAWMDANLHALRRLEAQITPENRELIAAFEQLRRDRSPLRREAGIRRLGLYRQTAMGSLSLHVAALLGKL